MNKKILSLFLSLVICLSMFPTTAYAKDSSKAYMAYQEAIQATTISGSWTEELTMTANMSISQGNATTKTKATVTSNMDISNYIENDLSNMKMSGHSEMSVMGQVYAWDVQYGDGVAHYKYTEPNQSSTDIEMEPSCFKFNTLTEDMMEKAKISGNKITFTIPGNKMEDAEIAAINLMPGIESLQYGDVDTEVILDKGTGAIDTLVMKFHASLTYQGYDAEVDYEIDYNFSKLNTNGEITENSEPDVAEEMKIENGLIVYSDYTNLSIRKGSTITLSAGIIINGERIEDVSGITFWTEDSSLLDISDTGIKNSQRYVKFKGADTGTTIVFFSDSNTGYTAEIPVTVYMDNYLSYTLNSVPTQYIDKYPTNIYNANGLYIDSYNYTVNDNKTALVSFDVYNTNYTYGVVEVYDAEGTLKGAELIGKMRSNSTSIKEALLDNSCCLIRDWIDGDFLSYRQESGYSKKTPISIEIPENGYIKISNDPENSPIVNVVNSVDVLMSLGKLAKKVKNYDVNSEVFSKELTSKMVTDKLFVTLVKDGGDFSKNLWKGVAKEAAFSSISLGNFCDTVAKNLSELNLGKMIADTAWDFGWDVSEDVFTYFMGPVDMVFDGLFAFGKLTDVTVQHVNLINSANVGSIYIQNQGGGIRSSQQITVESGVAFSDDTSLNVFRVTLDSAILNLLKEKNPEVYDRITDGTSYTYNISLLKNGEETQPDDEVTVYIPIPKDLKFLAYAGKTQIYRVEEDGSLTTMDVQIKDGCFVFNTSHFSLYTLVGENIQQGTLITVIGVVVIICILFLFFITRKLRKKKGKN